MNVFRGLDKNPIFIGIILFTVVAQYGLVEFGGAFVRTVSSMDRSVPTFCGSYLFKCKYQISLFHTWMKMKNHIFHLQQQHVLPTVIFVIITVIMIVIIIIVISVRLYLVVCCTLLIFLPPSISHSFPLPLTLFVSFILSDSLPHSISILLLQVSLDTSHWVKCILLGAMSLPIGGLMRFIPCEDSESDFAAISPLIKTKAAVKR